MTEKRFTYENHKVKDNITGEIHSSNIVSVNVLNALAEENEQLKQAYTQLKHKHSLIHDVCLDAECERDSLKKDVESLEKENEQLKKQIDNMAFILRQNGLGLIEDDD